MQNVQYLDSLVKFHVTTSVSRKIILADIANLAEIACIADIAKLAKLAEPSRLRIADKVSRAEPSRFSNGHLYKWVYALDSLDLINWSVQWCSHMSKVTIIANTLTVPLCNQASRSSTRCSGPPGRLCPALWSHTSFWGPQDPPWNLQNKYAQKLHTIEGVPGMRHSMKFVSTLLW